ncbi:SRPBCC family protein [Sanguibacter suaedae]|uniref:SRPBCC domain-containing protein n=1 Tax=Sanguibacter suaedae TaxID=2795737 RepID=A0A934I3F8_9MICO|nr:SRPBCC domain-containing protein [Sanguibacter suaedae]MBI9114874.1 SRPBCC domain-containing protein [Sanguibacter suaedae]
MPVVSSTKDSEALTMTFVSEHAAPPERVWQLWADPRLLERWWGPPEWPATFPQHDLEVGGMSRYYMTGPEGEQMWGAWTITAIDEPRYLAFDDGFADEHGTVSPEMGVTRAVVSIDPTDDGARMTIESTFESVEQLEQMVAMGMQEGMTQALEQIDELLV